MGSRLKLGKYEHFGGKRYRVIGAAKHSETLEEMAVYKALYGEGELWVRSLKMFLEDVEIDPPKFPRSKFRRASGQKVPRLKYIGD